MTRPHLTWQDWLLILWCLLVLAFAVYPIAAHGQTVQLSPGPVLLTSLPTISPDSRLAVWAQLSGIWSGPLGGGESELIVPLPVGCQLFGAAKITPDSLRVVFIADLDVLGKPELFSVPITGGSPTRISKAMAADRQVRDFLISPTSQRVYYAADGAVNNKMELWRVDIGGGESTKLNASFNTEHDVFAYAVNPQDQVVYRVGRSSGSGGHELWMAPGNGRGSQARKISRAMVTGGGVDATFAITKDGSRVLYVADAEDDGEFNLYSVAVSGGSSTRLNTVPSGVSEFLEDPAAEGARVVFEQTIGAMTSWFSVPVTGGTPVPVPPPMPEPVRSPDGKWIVYGAGVGLWSSGPGDVHRLVSCVGQTVTATFLGRPAFSVSQDSRRVLYVTTEALWSGPVSGAVCRVFSDGFESGSASAWIVVD